MEVNLGKALRRVLDKSTWYWIDAISIDQNNDEERVHQVQRMRDIYSTAETVTIWLGADNEGEDDGIYFSQDTWGFSSLERGSRETTNLTFRTFQLLGAHQRDNECVKSSDRLLGLNVRLVGRSFEGDTCDPVQALETNAARVWASVRRIMQRPWFERLWVIQEVQSARIAIVRCGCSVISWEELEKAVAYILRPMPQGTSAIPAAMHKFFPLLGSERLQNVALPEIKFTNILTILRQTRQARCKDPRDR